MQSARSEFAFALAVACVLWLPARSWAQDPQVREPAAAGARDELPPALKEVPPGRVVVSYLNSQLTIKARNAPFIDVVREVCSQLHAELDAPSDADDPVLAVWGPGPTREVLAAFLNHSGFNYALAGSADDPTALSFLAVFPRATDAREKTADADAKTDSNPTKTDANAKPTPGAVPSVMSMFRDLLAAAPASASLTELGQGAENGQVDQQTGGDTVAMATAQQVDPAALLDQIEAQMKNLEAAAQSVQADRTPSENPPGRPRRHPH